MGIFSFFGNSKIKSRDVIIFDVRASSVTAVAVKYFSNGTIFPIAVKKEHARFYRRLFPERLLAFMGQTLSKVSSELKTEISKKQKQIGKFSPKSAEIFLNTPWCAFSIAGHRSVFNNVKEITGSDVKEAMDFEEDAFRRTLVGEKHNSEFKNEVNSLEKIPIKVEINGYTAILRHPLRGRELSVTSFMSLVPKKIVDSVINRVDSFYGNLDVNFHTFISAALKVLHRNPTIPSDYIWVEVGDEETNIVLVKESLPVSAEDFSMGQNTLVRILSRELPDIPPQSALSLVVDIASSPTEEKKWGKAGELIKQSLSEWRETFSKTVEKLSVKELLPKNVILFADGISASLYKHFLESPVKFSEDDDSASFFLVKGQEEILRDDLLKHVKHPDAQLRIDTFLMMEILISKPLDF